MIPAKLRHAGPDAQLDLFLKNLEEAKIPLRGAKAKLRFSFSCIDWFSFSCIGLVFMVALSFLCLSFTMPGGFLIDAIASAAMGGGFYLFYVRFSGTLYNIITILFLTLFFGSRRIDDLLNELQAHAKQLSSSKGQENQGTEQ